MRDSDFSQINKETIRQIAQKFEIEIWEAKVKLQVTAEIHDWSLARAAEHLLNPDVRF